MPLNGEPATAQGLPVALATVTVDGRCRERSPVDQIVFGADGERLITRFVIAGEGEALLARTMTDGAAEAIAELRTSSGIRPFRISLWRQRGGEKIRLTAAFAEVEPEPGAAHHDSPPAHLVPTRALALASRALLGLSDRIRRTLGPDGQSDATDLMATAWRISNLAGEILAPGPRNAASAPASEIDMGLLVRRVVRVAEAAGTGPDLEIYGPGATEVALPRLLGDASGIWSLIDHLLLAAIEACAERGRILIGLDLDDDTDGMILTIEARAEPRQPTASSAGLDQARRIAMAHHARLVIDRTPEAPFRARVTFPSKRCLAAL